MSHHRETVTAAGAPDAVGPYSHAVKAGGLLFISARSRSTRSRASSSATRRPSRRAAAFENLSTIAAAGGCSLAEDSVKLTVYLTDIGAFADVNEVYGTFFEGRSGPRGLRRRRAAEGRAGGDRRDPGAARLSGVLMGPIPFVVG